VLFICGLSSLLVTLARLAVLKFPTNAGFLTPDGPLSSRISDSEDGVGKSSSGLRVECRKLRNGRKFENFRAELIRFRPTSGGYARMCCDWEVPVLTVGHNRLRCSLGARIIGICRPTGAE
jgi:hypothetical protein